MKQSIYDGNERKAHPYKVGDYGSNTLKNKTMGVITRLNISALEELIRDQLSIRMYETFYVTIPLSSGLIITKIECSKITFSGFRYWTDDITDEPSGSLTVKELQEIDIFIEGIFEN